MNKNVIMFFTIIFSLAGSYAPMLMGEADIFSIWAILGGFIGGIIGIWIGVLVCKRFI
jgi:hypothetical protein